MPRNYIMLLRVLAVITVIASIVIFAPVRALYVYLWPLSNDIQTEIDRAVDAGLVGVSVYIDPPAPQPEKAYAAGWHDQHKKLPARTDPLFKIGSISKLYIAAAVSRLVVNNQLNLDTTLLAYLPELASEIENADTITLRMLVQHRSGIPNFTDNDAFPWLAPFDQSEDTEKSLALISDMPPSFRPGESYAYSNTNYLLVARIIDKVLGYSYQKYINTQFITPLGLEQTYATVKQAAPDILMSGYIEGHDDDVKHLAFLSPAGAMVASPRDVAHFLRALNNGTLLNADEQKVYSTLYFDSHDGWLPGYLSFARYFEDIDTVIVLFTNTSGDESWLIADFTIARIYDILSNR